MKAIMGIEFLNHLADAGLIRHEDSITGVTIEANVHDAARLTVRRLLVNEGKLREVLDRYELHSKDNTIE